MFGTFIKELRTRRQLGLGEFCLEHGHDPGNWSRLERELLPPQHDDQTLRAWAASSLASMRWRRPRWWGRGRLATEAEGGWAEAGPPEQDALPRVTMG